MKINLALKYLTLLAMTLFSPVLYAQNLTVVINNNLSTDIKLSVSSYCLKDLQGMGNNVTIPPLQSSGP